jgi:hypothetical protein
MIASEHAMVCLCVLVSVRVRKSPHLWVLWSQVLWMWTGQNLLLNLNLNRQSQPHTSALGTHTNVRSMRYIFSFLRVVLKAHCASTDRRHCIHACVRLTDTSTHTAQQAKSTAQRRMRCGTQQRRHLVSSHHHCNHASLSFKRDHHYVQSKYAEKRGACSEGRQRQAGGKLWSDKVGQDEEGMWRL